MILATISSDAALHADVRAALFGRFRFEAVWDLGYDDAARLHGLKSDEKCLTIVDFADKTHGLPFARSLSGRAHITTIAVNCGDSREELLLLMQSGIRDVLSQFTSRDLVQAVNRALALLGATGEIVADLYAFIPAKPGCGTTTVATHAAGMASKLSEDPTLLLDFDFRMGLTSFLLKSEGNHSILDALEHAPRLDQDLWSNMVSQIGNLHLLGSGAGDFSKPLLARNCSQLLDFAVRHYSSVTVDLPGSMEDYECDVLLRSKQILLVCTSDISALHVAQRKSQWLQDLKLSDRVVVVLNCMERHNTFSVQDMERILQLPVRHLLPTGAKDIAKAIHKGEFLNSSCPLGRQIAGIASQMTPAQTVIRKPGPVRRFVEYFSISPVRTVRGT